MKPAKRPGFNTDGKPAGQMVNNGGHSEYKDGDPALNEPVPPLRVVAPPPAEPSTIETVPLRPRKDGWTAERQRTFLQALADTGSVVRAAEAAGITPRSAYRLRNHSNGAAFSRAWDAALMTAAKRLLGVAFERATTGASRHVWRDGQVVPVSTPPSDRLLMFLLQHLAPDLFSAQADPAHRLGRIEALQANFADALAALTDADVEADTNRRYPTIPILDVT